MSAKVQRYAASAASRSHISHNVNILDLPPELWLHIFYFATWTPEVRISDPDAQVSHLFSELEQVVTKGRRNRSRDSLVTKRYLIRVCKQWQALASPFLYECIVIGRVRTLSSLCHTLTDSRRKATDIDGRPLGWWTKRLEVAMRDQDFLRHEFDTLAEAIRCLPNLAAINFSVVTRYYSMPAVVLRSLAETCSHSLRVVTWSTPKLIPRRDDWWLFLSVASSLIFLHCPFAILTSGSAKLPVLPALTSLVLVAGQCHLYCQGSTINNFPKLQKIAYHNSQTIMFDHTWSAFLRYYGHGLTTVVLQCRYGGTPLQTHLELLTRFCPKLKRLDIFLQSWAVLVPDLVLPPITHFGVRCRELQPSSRKYRQLFEALGGMKAPSLKVVQLTDYRTVTDLRDRHPKVFVEVIASLKSRNLCLQDTEGHALSL